jgi:hypothetical protein
MLKSNGYKFPKLGSNEHKRFVYTELTAKLLIVDAEGKPFLKNESSVIDAALSEIEEAWLEFKEIGLYEPYDGRKEKVAA